MLSHTHRFIFVHIPKTAGTSVVHALREVGVEGSPGPGGPPRLPPPASRFDVPPPHLRAADYLRQGLVGRQEFLAYFKFAFVRNPWDRLVSEYRYRRHAHRYPFKEFLRAHFPRPGWTDEYCHVLPQIEFLRGEDGALAVDFVGRFEHLEEGFAAVCARLDLPGHRLPHDNRAVSILGRRDNNPLQLLLSLRERLSPARRRNTHASYVDYYDAESRGWVSGLYGEDIEAFGYRFGA